ncbi:MAG: hypothetical protein E7111_01315 [Bacteroidales bacterium]|nr:hypothetical protein [Bacteroidales bacterium]
MKEWKKLGYDIVTFSNHNSLTVHPFDTALQVNVYEHGYNLLKYHKLVFGSEKVWRYDHLLPLLSFQKQFQIERLRKDSDIVQINHPLRTPTLSEKQMEKLRGYRLVELDSGRSTENTYWDRALSAGHYSFGVAGDDLHYPDRSSRIGVRCCFLCCRSATYKDIRHCLLTGNFYAMRVPDYGHGDWEAKYRRNRQLPSVSDIGLEDTTVFMSLSAVADSIKVIGQDHRTLAAASDSDHVEYAMKPEDTYARMIAYFPDGEVIYTNPFARYDAAVSDSPFDDRPSQVNIPMTILFNLALLLLCLADAYLIYKLIHRRK